MKESLHLHCTKGILIAKHFAENIPIDIEIYKSCQKVVVAEHGSIAKTTPQTNLLDHNRPGMFHAAILDIKQLLVKLQGKRTRFK